MEKYKSLFINELKNNLLPYWLTRGIDTEYGGYINCFTNDGSRLVSHDKYTWSQGRFLWMFSKLAQCDVFTDAERAQFLAYAKQGARFLKEHVLIGKNDLRCVFLMERDGTHKYVDGYKELDMSISADCFVVMGFARYAIASGDKDAFEFAKALGESVWVRYNSGNYRSLPYPLSPKFISHAKPMILTHMCSELYHAAKRLDKDYTDTLYSRIDTCHREVFEVFCDGKLVHEFRYADGGFPDNAFGQHINPGHTLEDMWFQADAQDILGNKQYLPLMSEVVKNTLSVGWDSEMGGIYHFVACDGSPVTQDAGDATDEPQMKLVFDDWGSKLWWVHSEALYTALRFYKMTGDNEFFALFEKIYDYTFKTFPNPDKSVGEWIQIRKRDGKPQDKVVALPVKDPYHIIRNMILLIELLEN